MKQTVTIHTFREAFKSMGRADQFSYEALGLLFDYLEEIENSTGEEMELDVIAICCDYSEENILDLVEIYDIDLGDEAVAPENVEYIVQDFLEDAGAFVGKTSHGTMVFWHQ